MLTLHFVLRLVLAGVLGAVIGLEREYRSKDAGHRTHFLVALGSALLMIISQYGFADVLGTEHTSYDPSRIASQVVTGIGFLGAGTIILQRHYVRGLTTAAGIWATSAIGLAIGAGMYVVGIITTVLVLVGLETMNLFAYEGIRKNIALELKVENLDALNGLYDLLTSKGYVVQSCQIEQHEAESAQHVTLQVMGAHNIHKTLLPGLIAMRGITIVNIK